MWEGEMSSPFEVDGVKIVLVWPEGGQVKAYQDRCPHQDISLAEGSFEGKVIKCRAHFWTFSGDDGEGINPRRCKLAEYPVKVEDDSIYVDTAGIKPIFAAAWNKEASS
jgi:toluene monooxygenase system ferredoxin subunit